VKRAADEEIARGGGGDDGEVDEIPARVEEVVGEEHHGERAQPVSRGQPVREEDGGEKSEISRGGQQHEGTESV